MSHGSLFVVGATHHTAPLAIREKLTLSADAAAKLRAEFTRLSGLREFVLLSTCNRVEFYGIADTPEAISRLEAEFCAQQQFDSSTFGELRLRLHDREAVQHLFEVASGLDSQMLGETEIFGQVKEAYATAHVHRSAGPVLNRVFQKTFQAAKLARTQTAITEGQVSVANVAVELALNIFGSLANTRILLLGAGDIGEKTAKAFQSRGAASLTVASRRLERAMELASRLGASALPFEQHETRLAEFDVVVGSTAAPTTIVSLDATTAAMRKRPARPLFCIDLALPRDFDPAVARLQNVFLYNLDDLAQIAEANRAAREAEIAKCRTLLNERADALWRQIGPQIQALPSTDPQNGVAPHREASPAPRTST